MSESQDIFLRPEDSLAAPTPQNTPLNTTVLTSRPAAIAKPHVEDVAEDDEEEDDNIGANPASLLANVSAPSCASPCNRCEPSTPPKHTTCGCDQKI